MSRLGGLWGHTSRQGAKIRRAAKRRHHAKADSYGHTTATLAHGYHGFLGGEAKEQIRALTDEVCRNCSVDRPALDGSFETELSAATTQGFAHAFSAFAN